MSTFGEFLLVTAVVYLAMDNFVKRVSSTVKGKVKIEESDKDD